MPRRLVRAGSDTAGATDIDRQTRAECRLRYTVSTHMLLRLAHLTVIEVVDKLASVP
jgi:hypothetical protein